MWVLRIRGIEESSVYQEIFAKGEAAGRAKAEARAVSSKPATVCGSWVARSSESPTNAC